METFIEVKTAEKGGIFIFSLNGELDETNVDKTFTAINEKIGDYADKKVILDFKGLTYLNSKAIGYIADIYSHIEENDGKMYISGCDESVKDVLTLVGMIWIIPTTETLEEAVKEITK